jgi:uncharacterized glyoxalase superfamily protein PhnB
MTGFDGQKPDVYPVLRYRDANAAVDWLCRAFGAETILVVPGDDGQVRHGELKLGNGAIMLGSERDDPYGKAGMGAVYVAISDPDAHYARAKAAGAEIIREPQDTPYGAREYGAKDLEGNAWSFGTYRAGDPG